MVSKYRASSISSCFLLVGALLVSAPLLAQTQAVRPTGYELLSQAGAKITHGPNGGLSSQQRLTPEENLKNERLAVARNAPALALLRQALQKPIEFPLMANHPNLGSNLNSQARELARQLAQESDVRFADEDFVGAMNSKLDILDLATRFENGPLVESLTGNAIAGIGRKNFEGIATQLDAAQCRAAVARLKAIQARQSPFVAVLKQEQAQTRQLLVASLSAIQKDNLTEEGRAETGMDEEAAAQVAKLTPEQVQTDVNAVFEGVIENARFPFGSRGPNAPVEAPNPLLEDTVNTLSMPQTRFRFERSHAQDRLLLAALELRAQKLATGKYPDRFSAPTDPFSRDVGPLVYKKTDDAYLLYSVGPDGKDDRGTGFDVYLASQDAGNRTGFGFGGRFMMGEEREIPAPSADRLPPNYQGDIVQKPF